MDCWSGVKLYVSTDFLYAYMENVMPLQLFIAQMCDLPNPFFRLFNQC